MATTYHKVRCSESIEVLTSRTRRPTGKLKHALVTMCGVRVSCTENDLGLTSPLLFGFGNGPLFNYVQREWFGTNCPKCFESE